MLTLTYFWVIFKNICRGKTLEWGDSSYLQLKIVAPDQFVSPHFSPPGVKIDKGQVSPDGNDNNKSSCTDAQSELRAAHGHHCQAGDSLVVPGKSGDDYLSRWTQNPHRHQSLFTAIGRQTSAVQTGAVSSGRFEPTEYLSPRQPSMSVLWYQKRADDG